VIEELLESLKRTLREFKDEHPPRPEERPAEKPFRAPDAIEAKPEQRKLSDADWAQESNPEAKRLGTDPAKDRFIAREAITGRRLEDKLGEKLTRDSTGDFEWYVDRDRNRTYYDAMGNFDPKFYDSAAFKDSIDSHLLKKDAVTVIDMTGFSETQTAEISEYIRRLPREAQRRIIKLGF